MAMSDYEKSRFRFSETFNNSDGKTSGSAFIGVILGLVVAASWPAGILGMYKGFDLDVLEMFFKNTLALGGTSALLLGARKIVGAVINKNK